LCIGCDVTIPASCLQACKNVTLISSGWSQALITNIAKIGNRRAHGKEDLMFYFGVDYHPEHWPEERWSQDARLMAEAGFNIVRLAEFAWFKLEAEEGQYDFGWLDRAIAILASQDIRVVLGTPTALPPPWLMAKHPELFRVREDGQPVTFGNRRICCPRNPAFHHYSKRIVAKMAEHYVDHEAIIGWQIDNEFGDRCYCPLCARNFRDWLRRRYGSLDRLNQRWGTMFWSHIYTDWDQIPVPLKTGDAPHPGLALDFFRFSSESYVVYQQTQIDILREKCRQHFITHSFKGFDYDQINYFELAESLDLVGWDNHPRTQRNMQVQLDPSHAALAADTMRGLKRQNFWVMEQQAGPGGWETVSVAPRPGELRLWAYQSIAHGADTIIFSRWRAARFGTEQYWHGLLDHDGTASWRYQEIKQTGTEIKQIGEQIDGSAIKPTIAIMLSYDSRFAFQIQENNPAFSYADQFHSFYSAFHRHQVAVDIITPDADLSTYNLIIAPALHIVTDEIADNLKRFAGSGGVLVLTARSGVKDESNAVVDQRLPGLLAELCGIEVEEYDSLPPDVGNALEFSLPDLVVARPLSATVWCDVLQSNTATVVARYTRGYYAGKAAITLNEYAEPESEEQADDSDQLAGRWPPEGWVVYVGTMGTVHMYHALADWLLELAGLRPILAGPEGIEVTERWQGDERFLFLLNHAENARDLTLARPMTDLLTGRVVEQRFTLEPKEVMILH
jgi:beta-galactosidase